MEKAEKGGKESARQQVLISLTQIKAPQQVTLLFFSDFFHVFFGGQEMEEDAERVPWGFVLAVQVSVLRDIRETFYQEV